MQDNPEGFPWGENRPTKRQRIVVALALGVLSGAILYARSVVMHLERSDLSQVLFGSRALLRGADPYHLIGPGLAYDLKWGAVYPATAYVATIPLSILPDVVASSLFVALSTIILAYACTRDSWHRLPLFPSVAFASSVQFAQWSILATAILFVPWLAILLAIKPQAAIPAVAVTGSKRSLTIAIVGGVILLAISLVMLPSWPLEWLNVIRNSSQLRPPILRLGGVTVLLVLLRWRRREAWLVLLLACMPQIWAWYNLLPLLAIARTYREAAILSLVSSLGAVLTALFVGDPSPEKYAQWGAAMIAFAYAPCVIAILRRPNVIERAPWESRVQIKPQVA